MANLCCLIILLGVCPVCDNPFVTLLKSDAKGRIINKFTEVGDLGTSDIDLRSTGDCRLETSYTPLGLETFIDAKYTGNDCSVGTTAINNLSMSRIYDASGKLLSTTDADTESDTGPNTVEYWYDQSGNPLVLQDALGNQIETNFDALGRKQSVNDPNMGLKGFKYNSFGEVVRQDNPEGLYNFYEYDYIGRITQQLSNVDASGNPTGSDVRAYKDNYLYDPSAPNNAYGQLEVTTRQSNQYTGGYSFSGLTEYSKHYGYDDKSRMDIEETFIHNALNTGGPLAAEDIEEFTTKYYYDDIYNRLKQVNYKGGFAIRNYYTPFGALRLQKDGRKEETRASNDNIGQVHTPGTLLNVDLWNLQGAETKRTFNNDSNMSSTTAYYPSTGQVAEINNSSNGGNEQLLYQYDSWGNIINQELARGTDAAIEIFEYDQLHRLKLANVNGSSNPKTYMYDAIGNITSKSDFSDDYIYGGSAQTTCNLNQANVAPGPNAVARANALSYDGVNTSNESITYHYDAKGNRVQDCLNNTSKAYYTYDYNNLLIKSFSNITGSTDELKFNYGTDNQRYRKYDVHNQEITLYGNKDYERIYDNVSLEKQTKHYLTSYLTVTRSNYHGKKVHFMQKDRLGSTTQILEQDGTVAYNKSYDAFGKPRNGDWTDMGSLFDARLDFSSTEPNGTIDITKRGFTDHEHLDDMQLIHMNGRMYDYNNGRFLSVDPFIQAPTSTQSMNPYTYIFNNPLSGVDPTGYKSDLGCKGVKCLPRQNGREVTYTISITIPAESGIKNSDGSRSKFDDPSTIIDENGNVIGTDFSIYVKEQQKQNNSKTDTQKWIDAWKYYFTNEGLNDTLSLTYNQLTDETSQEMYSYVDPSAGGRECYESGGCGVLGWTIALSEIVPWGRMIDKGGDFVKTINKWLNPCNCLVADTQVLTDKGLANIQDIQVGDLVWAKDSETGISDWKPVISLFTNIPKPIYSIELETKDATIETIESTDDHPFYVIGKGWIETDELQSGYQIETKDGENVTVIRVELTGTAEVTYNFTVDDFNTYYVTEYGVLVHNDCNPFAKGVNPKSVLQFGHSFSRHGAGIKNTRKLTGRAASTGSPQGQFLNNQDAANFLSGYSNITKTVDVNLPSGLGQVIRPDGTIVNATQVRLVPNGSGGFRSAFPIE